MKTNMICLRTHYHLPPKFGKELKTYADHLRDVYVIKRHLGVEGIKPLVRNKVLDLSEELKISFSDMGLKIYRIKFSSTEEVEPSETLVVTPEDANKLYNMEPKIWN